MTRCRSWRIPWPCAGNLPQIAEVAGFTRPREAGIEEILEIKGGFLRVRTELLNCDLYSFLKNDPEAVNAYRGEYMEEYPWAVFNSEALATRE